VRIAQVLLRYDAPGGVETMVRELTRVLVSLGETVHVYASDLYDEGRWLRSRAPSMEVDGVPVGRFPVYRRLLPALTLPLMPGLISRLDADRPDLLHAHSHRYGHVLQTAAVAEARSIPLVVSTHYHPADRGEPWAKRGLLRLQDHLFGMTAYRKASALVVESAFEARQVSEFAPGGKVRVIPPGIDLDAWGHLPSPEAARQRTGLPARYLLFSGRLARNKGLPFLLDAFSRLPPTQRIPLVLLGRDWGMGDLLRSQARERGVGAEVTFLAERNDPEEYRAVFAGAEAFVLPSEYEAFGLVLLEAMASGLPIVATRVGGVPELVEEGGAGLLVPYGDREALVAALAEVIGDPARRRSLSARGRERVRGYSWRRTGEAFRTLYRSL